MQKKDKLHTTTTAACAINLYLFLLLLDGDCLQALERRHGDKRSNRVQSFLSILIVISLTRQTDTYAIRHVAYTAFPDLLVETGVDTHVRSTHVLFSELADHLDSTWRFSLVAILANVWVEMDSVVTGNHFRASGFAIAWRLVFFCHHMTRTDREADRNIVFNMKSQLIGSFSRLFLTI